jgi:hypothetical protein
MLIGHARQHQHQTVTVLVCDTTVGPSSSQRRRQVRPAHHQPAMRNTEGQRAADRYLNLLDHMSRISWRTCVADQLSDQRRSLPLCRRR